MLPKSHRLTRKDFLLVKKLGQNNSSSHFSFLSLSSPLSFSRYSVVTSAKLHKSAVVRNRLRRAIYTTVANLSGHHDIIIFPKKPLLNLSSAELKDVIVNGLNSAPLIPAGRNR